MEKAIEKEVLESFLAKYETERENIIREDYTSEINELVEAYRKSLMEEREENRKARITETEHYILATKNIIAKFEEKYSEEDEQL